MHYRNGREGKNGDTIVQIDGYGDGVRISAVGVLHGAKPGSDHCNGNIAPVQSTELNTPWSASKSAVDVIARG